MDIKGLYQGSTGAKKQKVYGILSHMGYIYFPIAAQRNPYPPYLEAFAAGMPNFFGGNKDRKTDGKEESDCEALIREIEEESQGNINVKFGDTAMKELYRSVDRYRNPYHFYLVNTGKCEIVSFNPGAEVLFTLCSYEKMQSVKCPRDGKYYEASHLVRMKEEAFRELVKRLWDNEPLVKSLQGINGEDDTKKSKEQIALEQRLLGQITTLFKERNMPCNFTVTSVLQWYDSHTAQAFRCI